MQLDLLQFKIYVDIITVDAVVRGMRESVQVAVERRDEPAANAVLSVQVGRLPLV